MNQVRYPGPLIKFKVETPEELIILMQELEMLNYYCFQNNRNFMQDIEADAYKIIDHHNKVVVFVNHARVRITNLSLLPTPIVSYMAIFTEEIRDMLIKNIEDYKLL